MKNQSFQTAKELKNRRKLDVTLRRFTNDRLTKQQRRLISSALSRRRQHSLQVYQTEEAFCQAVKERTGNAGVRMLFGCPETHRDAPAAALIGQAGPGRASSAVYIYLPTETEEKRDDSR